MRICICDSQSAKALAFTGSRYLTEPRGRQYGGFAAGVTVSIEKMIQLHPNVGREPNEALAKAARHSMLCSLFCASCADACSAEDMDMHHCIRTCHDCANICAATAHVAVRRTGRNEDTLVAQLETCVTACNACAAECEAQEHEHCKLCATMCRECSEDCRKALATLE